jgi:membrane-bound metal-dependent hydrolase YbcI (DUF457 family)
MMKALMPSPIGHMLAGVATAWAADLLPGQRSSITAQSAAGWYDRVGGGLTVACAALAAAPDLDLLFGVHRMMTHSLSALVVVALGASVGAGISRRPIARVALTCTFAYATHLMLDLLAADPGVPRGIQLLWPFSRTWFYSGLDIFPSTERNNLLSAFAITKNATALVREVAILGPILIVTWLVRVKALAGLSTELARRDHPTQ